MTDFRSLNWYIDHFIILIVSRGRVERNKNIKKFHMFNKIMRMKEKKKEENKKQVVVVVVVS